MCECVWIINSSLYQSFLPAKPAPPMRLITFSFYTAWFNACVRSTVGDINQMQENPQITPTNNYRILEIHQRPSNTQPHRLEKVYTNTHSSKPFHIHPRCCWHPKGYLLMKRPWNWLSKTNSHTHTIVIWTLSPNIKSCLSLSLIQGTRIKHDHMCH